VLEQLFLVVFDGGLNKGFGLVGVTVKMMDGSSKSKVTNSMNK
jgi:hypothetical protein